MNPDFNMPLKPKIRDHFDILRKGNRFLISSVKKIYMLEGTPAKTFEKIYPYLDGNSTVDDLVSIFPDTKELEIKTLIAKLFAQGILEDCHVEPEFRITQDELDFYDKQIKFFLEVPFFTSKYLPLKLLKNSKVAIFGLGGIGSQVLTMMLVSGIGKIIGVDHEVIRVGDLQSTPFYVKEDVGKTRISVADIRCNSINPYVTFEGVSDKIERCEDILEIVKGLDLAIVCMDSPDVSLYRLMNEALLEGNIKWTSGTFDGIFGVVGPSIIPHETCCYTCYEYRRKANTEQHIYSLFKNSRRIKGRQPPERGCLSPFLKIISGYITIEALKFLTKFSKPATLGALLLINLVTHRNEIHSILRLPSCPSCRKELI